MTGLTSFDTVSPAIARPMTPTLAPHAQQQPQKTHGELTALGARGSRAWEARPGGATPLPTTGGGRSPGARRVVLT